MIRRQYRLWLGLFGVFATVLIPSGPATAADAPAVTAEDVQAPPAPLGWTFRVTPYAWLPAMNGTQTVRGRSVSVDASFIDIAERADTLVGLMGEFEARRGPVSFYGNAVWSKVGLGADRLTVRSVAPNIAATTGISSDLDVQMGILELGGGYEVLRANGVSLDLVVGVRGWLQKAELAIDLAGVVDIGNLEIVGNRAIARSGSVRWVDPIVGFRSRYAVSPGHHLFLRGDIGGFGVGSKFSWQAAAGYGFDFSTRNGVTYSGIIGYRALYADYRRGAGRNLYEFDIVQHGPVLGLSARF